jgi:hemerythrin-like domain-containing protein
MNALDLLKRQHREVERLFKKLKNAKGAQKERTFVEIADKLAVHASIEEKIFYPAVMSDETEEQLEEAVQEHLQMKRMLADMLDMDVGDDRFDAKLTVLEEEVSHHLEEEEDELFKKVAKQFEKEALQKLGEEMQMLGELLSQAEPRKEIPKETEEAAPLD